MISKIFSASCFGIDAHLIEVEVDISAGLPQTNIVGLPDQAVKESKERVKSAIKNSDFHFSSKKLTINLAPADLKKEGPSFDLAIAVGILVSSGFVQPQSIHRYLFLGELALDGSLRKVRGALPAAGLAKRLGKPIVLPHENIEEALLEEDVHTLPARNLREVIQFLNGESELQIVKTRQEPGLSDSTQAHGDFDFSEVKGQWHAKRAVEIAAAGGHNLLLIGPPGAGKSMLGRRIPSILPPPSHSEAIEICKIHSVAGLFQDNRSFFRSRPFRAPHHTVSNIGLVGGGTFPKPGEISLAHGGVLFLDEFPEFRRDAIEALRAPLEDHQILISRAKQNLTFPANFLLVCAMNPCPCGYLMSKRQSCRCSLGQIQKYLNKISGPILDRIDLHVELPAVEYKDLASTVPAESSNEIKARIIETRKIQTERFNESAVSVNAEMRPKEIRKFCSLNQDAKKMLEQAMKELEFSARGYYKIIKIARTIADLAHSEPILPEHIAEALQYRSLDRQWLS